MSVQADDKIVCAGVNNNAVQAVRYLPDGIIDSAFGNNGIASPKILETYPLLTSIVLQPDQKILLASDGYKNGVPTIVLLRLLPDGSLDENFGRNGIVDSTFGIGESISHIALQPDGKILVLGWYYPGFILMRYNSNGSLDESFGDEGKAITVFGAGTVPSAIDVEPDGRIIAAGNYGGGVGYSKFLLALYTTEGQLDESFGNKGVTTTDFGKYGDEIHSITIQSDGKILAAGTTGVRDIGDVENMALAKYNTDGSLDASFGIAGKTTIVFNDVNSKINDLLVEGDGKILLAGSTYQKIYYGDLDFVVVRLNSNGILDSGFGTNGITVTDFGSYDGAEAIALQQNKIILAGNNSINGENPQINYALARYNNDESRKQILIAKIRRWLQHHNGIVWDNMPGAKSYAVQRSADGIRWTTIHTQQVTANSQSSIINSQQPTVNSYNDPSPSFGPNYYRLQTTRVSGAVANSNVIAVTSDALNVSLAPNPAKNTLSIAGLPANEKVKLTVVDFSGNVKLQAVANAASYNLNIASLHAGNYVMKMDINGEVISKQFVKE